MQIPSFPNFKKIDLTLKNDLLAYLNSYRCTISELNLHTILMWQHMDSPEATLINGNLCILLHEFGETFFLEPIGNNLIPQTIATCLNYCGTLSHLSEQFISQLPHANNYQLKELPEFFDYIYSTKDLAELKGSKYHSKRNHISTFLKEYTNFACKEITVDFKDHALKIFDQWASGIKSNKNDLIPLSEQRESVVNAFEIFSAMNFTGKYLEVNNQPVGFAMGSQLNSDTFELHFLYCLAEISGGYQMLLQQFCKQIQDKFPLISLEEDLGIAGLRKMKLSYHPIQIVKKYILGQTPTLFEK